MKYLEALDKLSTVRTRQEDAYINFLEKKYWLPFQYLRIGHKANNRLSACASELIKEIERQYTAWDSIPSAKLCYGMPSLASVFEKRLKAILAKHNYTPRNFLVAVEWRIGRKNMLRQFGEVANLLDGEEFK